MMRERGVRVVGLDFSREAARGGVVAAAGPGGRGGLRARAAARRQLRRRSPCFTWWSTSTIRARTSRRRASCWRRDGRLIVQVPNAASLAVAPAGAALERRSTCRATCIDFRDRDLETVLVRSGFEVVRRKYFSLRDNPAGLASSLAPALDPMARRVRARAGIGRRAAGARTWRTSRWWWRSLPFARRWKRHAGGARCPRVDDRGAAGGRTANELHAGHLRYTACRALLCGATSCISRWRSKTPWPRFARAAARRARACSMRARAKASTRSHFARQRYCGVDLAVGDAAWDYSRLDAVADLTALPFRDGTFDAADPHRHPRAPAASRAARCAEIARTLAPGATAADRGAARMGGAPGAARLFPLHALRPGRTCWKRRACEVMEVRPVGGYFRLLARRLLNGLQFFTGGLRWLLFPAGRISAGAAGADSAVFWIFWTGTATSHSDTSARHEKHWTESS